LKSIIPSPDHYTADKNSRLLHKYSLTGTEAFLKGIY